LLVVFERQEKRCCDLTVLNRFNASNSARSSQTAQAQNFARRTEILTLDQVKFGAGTHEQARCTSIGSTVRYRLIYCS
jgi:hypothetical protein